MAQSSQFSNRGQVLVEFLVAVAISAILIPAITAGFIASRQGQAQARQRLAAAALAREADEAVRVVRDTGWENVAMNGIYHPAVAGDTWTLVPGTETIDGFTRSVTVGDVIPFDPSKKLVTVSVSWGSPIASTVTNQLYLTRLTNRAWVQTTIGDFDAGTKTNVITTDTWGGEVTLGAGGKGDWCEPNLTIAAVDLPKQGVANAISAIEGTVFAGTGDNSSGVSYATVRIDQADPPTATISGTYNGFKTNGIWGEPNYAYLATDNNAKEIEIVDLTTTPYSEAGYFNAPGNGNGDSITTSGGVGYMTSGSTFYTFDVTAKTGSRPKLGSVTLDGTGVKTVVAGGYAYVAIASATTQMDIVNVTNPASPVLVAKAQLTAGAGKDVFVNSTGTRAYVATAYVSGKPEFSIINTTVKSGVLSAIGSYATDGMSPKALTVVTGNRAIIVGTGGVQQYVVIDVTDETNPVHCTSRNRSGGLSIATGVNGIASVIEADGDTFSYIITGDANNELKIIQGGPGGKYSSSGTFESSTLDATTSAAFNRFDVNGILPVNTVMQYQVAGANPVNGSCNGAAFTFVGPDGTGNTKFATSGAIPLSGGPGYVNPARCFRYKTFLSTNDTFAEPIFTDITVNYSP